jgi:hypothetical protein
MQNPSKLHRYLFRPAFPLLSIPSRQRSSREVAGLLRSLMGLKTHSLPGWSPGLLLLEQSLSLLLVGGAQLVVGLFARVALRVLLVLLLLLPELGLLPAFVFPAVESMLVYGIWYMAIDSLCRSARVHGKKNAMKELQDGKEADMKGRVGGAYGVRSLGSSGHAKGSFNSTVMRFCDLGRRHGPYPLPSRVMRVSPCAWT